MTGNEIIKALECCAKEDCESCPLSNYDGCKSLLFDGNIVLDLIKSQKAEIERLQKAYKQCAWERDVFAGDFEKEIKESCSVLQLDINAIKSEAIKEFAERLKAKCTTLSDYRKAYVIIDNLVKEMVSEEYGRYNDEVC